MQKNPFMVPPRGPGRLQREVVCALTVVTRAFGPALRQTREEETEKFWLNLLELLRDGTDALIADMRARRLS